MADGVHVADNYTGRCGSVAAAMMLEGLDQFVSGVDSVVPLPIAYGNDLATLLQNSGCEMSGGGSTSGSVCQGITNMFGSWGLSAGTPKYVYAIQVGFAESNIQANKPVVLALGGILGSPYGDHMVTAYGFTPGSQPPNNTVLFLCNIGWNDSVSNGSQIINANWSIGVTYIDF